MCLKGGTASALSSFSFYIKTLGGCVNTGGRINPPTNFGLSVNNKNLSFINKWLWNALSLSFGGDALFMIFSLSLYMSLYCLPACFLKGFIWLYMRCMVLFCFYCLFYAAILFC